MEIVMTTHEIEQRLERIEQSLKRLLSERIEQEYYSTRDVAGILGKAEFTVREWCRHGRINAEKRASGRGRSKEWMISNHELRRLQSEGLLPLR
jgi:transposase